MMNRYQIAIACFAFVLLSMSAQASFKINVANFKSHDQVQQSDNKQDKQPQQDKKGQKDKPKSQTTGKAPDIVMVPKARKQSRPKVVKPKVTVKPIKVIKPKIKKP